jgi:type IV secretion system protein VirB2
MNTFPLSGSHFRASRFCATAIFALSASGGAFAQTVGGEPAGSSPINGALLWVQGTLLGNLATTAAGIAVAVVGLMMLTGRIDWKRGLTVILGAFILFGAASIVAGIRSAATTLHS